ncbi:hypothetical protein RRG08_026927 [Elysia crispata]|uniref:Uncharacterized protein n=1 Tax=Elysia crispata TaxID=231223 RepID=A0AAE0Z5J1_9GAST|nr:hypothetical protein RRG08_026927 [Elysia crispata]
MGQLTASVLTLALCLAFLPPLWESKCMSSDPVDSIINDGFIRIVAIRSHRGDYWASVGDSVMVRSASVTQQGHIWCQSVSKDIKARNTTSSL